MKKLIMLLNLMIGFNLHAVVPVLNPHLNQLVSQFLTKETVTKLTTPAKNVMIRDWHLLTQKFPRINNAISKAEDIFDKILPNRPYAHKVIKLEAAKWTLSAPSGFLFYNTDSKTTAITSASLFCIRPSLGLLVGGGALTWFAFDLAKAKATAIKENVFNSVNWNDTSKLIYHPI